MRPNSAKDGCRQVADAIGTRHQELVLTEGLSYRQLDAALDSLDQPTFDGLNSYYMSHAVRDAGFKVALVGSGGDELFGGYSSFRDLPRFMRLRALSVWHGGSPRAFVPSWGEPWLRRCSRRAGLSAANSLGKAAGHVGVWRRPTCRYISWPTPCSFLHLAAAALQLWPAESALMDLPAAMRARLALRTASRASTCPQLAFGALFFWASGCCGIQMP